MRLFRFAAVFLLEILLVFPLVGNSGNHSYFSSAETPISIQKKNYNVLLITIDTWRYDRLGIHSRRYVKTPNLDKIALKSFVFKNAFAHNPVTLPSHVNILTGTTPLFHGVSDNSGFMLEDGFLTIAEFLKAKKYSTSAFVGAFPLDSRFGLTQGFDLYDDEYGTYNSLDFFFVERRAEVVVERAVDWISRQSQKWFSWVHLFDPHQPYLPPDKFQRAYPDDLYSGEVAYVDDCLGKLFGFLEKKKIISQTVVVVTGDHGEALGEKGEQTHAYFAYNNTIHVPLFIFIPESGYGFIEENACHADIFPTLCDVLSLGIPSHIQGESLIPIIKGKNRRNSEIYFESLTAFLNRGWAPLRGFIKGNIKFIDLPIREVYDLKKDADENNNLAQSHNTQKLKSDLVKLQKKMEGKQKTQRSAKIDAETKKKLETLGYLSGGSPSTNKKNFTAEDDLKSLLPLQNRMLDALNDFQRGMDAKAIRELKAVVAESPTFVLVYRHMATIYKKMGQVEDAVAILRAGLKKNPDNANLMSKLGIMLTETGQADEAINLLEKTIRKDEYDPEVFNYLGVAYYRKGNFKSALENYRKVLEIDVNYAPVYNNLGSLYLATFQKDRDDRAYEMAVQNFNRALDIDPKLFSALNGRGSAYYFKKKFGVAQQDWKNAIESNPDFAEPYFNIGISFLQAGDKKTAQHYFLMCKNRLFNKLTFTEQKRLERLIQESAN